MPVFSAAFASSAVATEIDAVGDSGSRYLYEAGTRYFAEVTGINR